MADPTLYDQPEFDDDAFDEREVDAVNIGRNQAKKAFRKPATLKASHDRRRAAQRAKKAGAAQPSALKPVQPKSKDALEPKGKLFSSDDAGKGKFMKGESEKGKSRKGSTEKGKTKSTHYSKGKGKK